MKYGLDSIRLVVLSWFLVGSSAFGADSLQLPESSKQEIDYTEQVQPLLAKRCYGCHGPKKQEGGLRLDRRVNLLRGGESGEPAILIGKSEQSQLIRFVATADEDERMPPEGPRLSATQVGVLRAWIDQGLKWPGSESSTPTVGRPTTDHWSFQPVSRPAPPTANETWTTNPIDAFIWHSLRKANLQPSPEADRVMLIRRLYLTMHGLPPTPAEVREFVQDAAPGSYRRLVERVLKSPRYGERWARHWLDVVRFAESNGFETNRERPNAYHYRDYVIDAFNSDKPYDRFVLEQLAGDALGNGVGTGFLVAGPYDLVKSPDINLTLMQRQNELDDMINTTGTTFLGLTVGCARCHNHKFDPITQTDYYGLQAVFAGVQHGERAWQDATTAEDREQAKHVEAELASAWQALSELLPAVRPAINAVHNVEYFAPVEAQWIRFTINKSSASEPCLDELEVFTPGGEQQDATNVALATLGTVATSSGVFQDGGHPLHQLEHINDGAYGNAKSWISKKTSDAWIQLKLPSPVQVHRIEWARDRKGSFRDRLAIDYRIEVATEPGQWKLVASSADHAPAGGQQDATYRAARIAKLPADKQKPAQLLSAKIGELEHRLQRLRPRARTAYLGTFRQPQTTHRLYRGDPQQKREEVGPDALAVIGSLDLKSTAAEQQRRVALAKWIVSRDNPLTARVIVNRIWHYQFGNGIVPTPSDFGGNGQAPSHPQLLDWLASELMEHDWSLKHIHRLILLSSTYRQTSLPRDDGLAKDAACQLLWRFPPRRLEAEAIRDSILHVSGVLDLRMGGPGYSAFDVQLENVRHYFPKTEFGPAEWRRMVYMTKYRMEQDAVFGAFDCPDGSQTMPRRSRSTTPLQALNLLNSRFMLQQADRLAQRLTAEAGGDPRRQVDLAFRLCFGRPPDADELLLSLRLLESRELKTMCRALLNCNEFLFVP